MKALRVSLVLVLIVSAFALSGCEAIARKASERIAEEAIEGSTGDEVDITEDGVSFEGDDGTTATFSQSGEVPESFPKDVPVYEGTIITSVELNEGFTLGIETDDAPGDIIDWYEKELGDDGWKQEMKVETGEGAMFGAKKGERTVQIATGAGTEKKTLITLMLTEPEAATE